MGLHSAAYPFAKNYPDAAMEMILAARTDIITGWREEVYLFQGTDTFAGRLGATISKIGRSRIPAQRLKQVRTRALTINAWQEVHRITCCSTQRMSPSSGDTLEHLLHGLFARYQTATNLGREYFALPTDAVDFLTRLTIIDALALNIALLNAIHSREYN